MSLRPKIKRRLLVIITLLIVGSVAIFWIYRRPGAREALAARELRDQGMAAYGRADYAVAMPKLSAYLGAIKVDKQDASLVDADVLLAFAECRRRIPLPRQQHLVEATKLYERYLGLRPADDPALHALLKLLSKQRRFAEAAALGDRILRQKPDDLDALYAKAFGAFSQPKPDLAAVEVANNRLLALDPSHYFGQLLAVNVLLGKGGSADDAIARVQKLQLAHSDEPRFQLIVARTYAALAEPANHQDATRRSEWRKAGLEWLGKAASRDWLSSKSSRIDADFVGEVVAQLEQANLFYNAISYLGEALKKVSDPDLERMLVRKLWQEGVHAEVVSRTDKLDGSLPQTDPDLLAYRAMAMQTQAAAPSAGDSRTRLLNAADAIAAALASRTQNPDAQAWAIVLQSQSGAAATSPAERVRMLRSACERNADNAVARTLLGDALLAAGEAESAADSWERARRLQSDWAYPLSRIAALRADESNAGDGDLKAKLIEAESNAWAAYVRSPLNTRYAAMLAQIRFMAIGKSPDPKALATLLTDVEAFQAAAPADTLAVPLSITLIARVRGIEPAKARLAQALASVPPLPVESLIQLRTVNDAEMLGQGDAIATLLAGRDTAQPTVVMQSATELLRQGKSAEGLALLEQAKKRDAGNRDVAWQIAIADFRERSGDVEATRLWATLGDAHANDLSVQLRIVHSNSVRRTDRDLWKRTIDRLKALSGEEGSLWKTEQALWLLAGKPNAKERADAIALLTDVAQRNSASSDAHHLLGAALLSDGRFEDAAKSFITALVRRPGQPGTALQLVQALRGQSKFAQALEQLKEIAAYPGLTPEQRMAVATHFEELGATKSAIDAVLASPESGQRDARLGRLYKATGQFAEAATAYDRLLNEPTAQSPDLYAGADFAASRGQAEKAQLFLDRLQTMSQSAAVTQMLLGQFCEAYGPNEAAAGHLTQATALEPKNAITWKTLAGYQLRVGDYGAADKAVQLGLTSSGANADLAAMQSLIRIVRAMPRAGDARALIELLSRNPGNDRALATLQVFATGQAAIEAAGDAAVKAKARADLSTTLLNLAEKQQDFWPLQEFVIRDSLAQGKLDQAARLSWRAIPMFPNASVPAQFAVEAHSRLSQWKEVVKAAQIWRERSAGDTLPADLTIAEASLNLHERIVAERTLAPHIRANPLPSTGATSKPTLRPIILELYRFYARSLIEANREREAASLLAPLLSLDAEGRMLWLSLASAHSRPASARTWIEQAAATMPTDAAVNERIALADAWLEGGRSTSDVKMIQQASTLIAPLLEPIDKAPDAAVWSAARSAHYLGEVDRAVMLWRQAWSRTATPASGLTNNLAYILLVRADPKDVSEALRLSNQAVAGSPTDAVCVATLALAQSRAGEREQAILTYRRAFVLDAENLEAMLGLAEAIARHSPKDKTEARDLLKRVREGMKVGGMPLPEIQRQLEAVSATLNEGTP